MTVSVLFFAPDSTLQSVNAPQRIIQDVTMSDLPDVFIWRGNNAKEATVLTEWLQSEGLPYDLTFNDLQKSMFRPGQAASEPAPHLISYVIANRAVDTKSYPQISV